MNGAMRSMTLVLGAVAWACVVTLAQPSAPAVSAEQIQRGKYLVEHVAMCIQCHTPRTAQGALDHTRLFQGAPIPIPTPFPMQPWAFAAPKIAGLPGWTVYLDDNRNGQTDLTSDPVIGNVPFLAAADVFMPSSPTAAGTTTFQLRSRGKGPVRTGIVFLPRCYRYVMAG